MSVYKPHQRKKRGKARERQAARHRKQARQEFPVDPQDHRRLRSNLGFEAGWLYPVRRRLGIVLRDIGWYLRNHPVIMRSAVFIVAVVVVLYFLSFLFSGKILPRVHSIGVDLGGMTVEEARTALYDAWHDLDLVLVAEGEIVEVIHPGALGIRFDAEQTARAARGVRLAAIPFGSTVEPVVEIDRLAMQNYLLNLADRIDIRPYSAGYAWRDGELVGVEGSAGRMLDVPLTIEQLVQGAPNILNRGQLQLLMIPLPPESVDPTPFMDDMELLVNQPIQLNGYDPYANQFFTWPVAMEDFTNWIAVGPTSLTLREEAFLPFLDLLNSTLNPPDENVRYLAPTETTNTLREAIADGVASVDLRIRYYPTVYTVVQGDSSYAISRKTGIPRYLIVEANRGQDLEILSIGDEINIPSRDATMPEPPVRHKRIVVDLETQYLVAFENGQVRFEWPISSGVPRAYTAPGIYQILSHQPLAYGSSNMLCANAGVQCGNWEMSWFMGIYQVQEGLVNGFHGKVLLPSGNYLGDGMLGTPVTFGCIMSGEEEAKLLYDWAEVGTVVEIISNEYPPMSDLGRLTLSMTRGSEDV